MVIFSNALILCGEDFEVTKGFLEVEEGIITRIGEGSPGARDFIDLKRGIVCPAFTNAHTHIGDAQGMDRGTYIPIQDIVGKDGIKFHVISNPERVKKGIEYSLEEMKNSGTSAFCDFREGGIAGSRLLKDALSSTSIDGKILGRANGESLDGLIDVANGVGISSVADYSDEELREIRRKTEKSGKLMAVHSCETEDDLAHALKYDPDFLVHLTNMEEGSIEQLARKKIPAVICPRANANLGVGIPPVKDIMQSTLTGIGTDNVMINTLNMLREMEFAFKVTRGLYRDHAFDARDILRAATINGRKILGLGENSIAPENFADFLVFKNRKYIYDPVVGIIHRSEVTDIKFIIKGTEINSGGKSLV